MTWQADRPKTLQKAVEITLQNYGVAAIIAFIFTFFVPWWLLWCLLYLGGIVFLASVLAPFVEDWRPKSRVLTEGKAVVISGCDSGFGHSLAQRLDDLGLHVFAGCLFPEKQGAQSLKNSCSERLHILRLDVTSDDSVQSALKYVEENIGDRKLWALVNNAGLNGGAEMMWTSLEIMKHIFDVNTFGVMRMTKAFLPLLCRQKGRVVTVASAAGRYTFPGLVPYSMTKQATISFCEGLRIEMYRFGVQFITIEPSMYKTPITNEENILEYISKSWNGSSSEVQQLYPEGYLEQFKRVTIKFIRWSISDRPQEVVSCLEEAVLSQDPKYSYMPGTVCARLALWCLRRLPKQIADAAVHDECIASFT